MALPSVSDSITTTIAVRALRRTRKKHMPTFVCSFGLPSRATKPGKVS